jgi:hypothetical protein
MIKRSKRSIWENAKKYLLIIVLKVTKMKKGRIGKLWAIKCQTKPADSTFWRMMCIESHTTGHFLAWVKTGTLERCSGMRDGQALPEQRSGIQKCPLVWLKATMGRYP